MCFPGVHFAEDDVGCQGFPLVSDDFIEQLCIDTPARYSLLHALGVANFIEVLEAFVPGGFGLGFVLILLGLHERESVDFLETTGVILLEAWGVEVASVGRVLGEEGVVGLVLLNHINVRVVLIVHLNALSIHELPVAADL